MIGSLVPEHPCHNKMAIISKYTIQKNIFTIRSDQNFSLHTTNLLRDLEQNNVVATNRQN